MRETDTQKYFDDKKPLCVVYYDVEYSLDPKGISSIIVITMETNG